MAKNSVFMSQKKYQKNNLKFFQRFWAVAQLYWCSDEKWGAISSVLILLVLLQVTTQLNVFSNTQQGNFLSALAAKDAHRFWTSIGIFLGLQIILVPVGTCYSYVRFKLILCWRCWLINHLLGEYLSNRAFYKLNNFQKEIDNPDQRISEDIPGFTEVCFSIFLDIFNTCVQLIAFSGVLWGISLTLIIFLVIYIVDRNSANL
jgi:putative ATP-binding cassette transporter